MSEKAKMWLFALCAAPFFYYGITLIETWMIETLCREILRCN